MLGASLSVDEYDGLCLSAQSPVQTRSPAVSLSGPNKRSLERRNRQRGPLLPRVYTNDQLSTNLNITVSYIAYGLSCRALLKE